MCQYNPVIANVRHANWAKQVRDMLQNSGFNDVWCFTESVNETIFIPLLRHRLREIYIAHWHTGLNTCTPIYMLKLK